jgi:iduronate 2-sulfatase
MNFPLHLPIPKLSRWLLLIVGVCTAASYTSGRSAADEPAAVSNSTPAVNVLLICIDDLRNELSYLGAPHAKTPQLDRFATSAVSFSHHYVQVPTCGASRAALMRGRYPDRREHLSNNAIAATQQQWAGESLPGWFARHGYQTYSLGKVTHYPGNLRGPNWNTPPE